MGEKIKTQHPDPVKRGRNMDQMNYDAVRNAVLETLRKRGEMTLEALRVEVERRVRGRFEGSVSWYYTTVKLDLEARKLMERVPRSRPQRVRLAGSKGTAGGGRPVPQRRASKRRK